MLYYHVMEEDVSDEGSSESIYDDDVCDDVLLSVQGANMQQLNSPIAPTFSPVSQCSQDSLDSTDELSVSPAIIVDKQSTAQNDSTCTNSSAVTTESVANEWKGFKIVGDYLDFTIFPRNQTLVNQIKSLHLFHSYAVLDRVNLSGFTDTSPNNEQLEINFHSFLSTAEDVKTLVSHSAVLIARLLVKHVPGFAIFSDVVPQHIHHPYYEC